MPPCDSLNPVCEHRNLPRIKKCSIELSGRGTVSTMPVGENQEDIGDDLIR